MEAHRGIKTKYGDGTVTTASTLGYLGGNNIILEGKSYRNFI